MYDNERHEYYFMTYEYIQMIECGISEKIKEDIRCMCMEGMMKVKGWVNE